MELPEAQSERIAPSRPGQRGNVQVSNLPGLNALLSVAEQGASGGFPPWFGRWHTLSTWMNRWAKNGVLDRVFEPLQKEQLGRLKPAAVSLDSPSVKVHPHGIGARKKPIHRPAASPAGDGPPRCIWVAAAA